MPQNQAGSVYVPGLGPGGLKTPAMHDEELRQAEAQRLTLTAAAEQQREKIAAAEKQRKQQAWLQDAVKRHTVDGKPDYDSVIAEGASMFPEWALEASKTLEQQRHAIKQARTAELQAEKLSMDNDLEVLKRMTPSSYAVYFPKLSPELQQTMGPTFDPVNTPKLIAELAGKGQTEAQRLENLRLLMNKDTRAALLTELDTATTPEEVNEVWSGWEALFGVKDMAGMRQRIGDVSTPAGKARLQALIGEQASPTAAAGFTLGPGQQRFDAQGNPIASVAPRPEGSGATAPVAVMGPDGKAVFVRPTESYGRTPANTREQGRPVTSGDAGRIADYDTSLMDLDVLTTELSGNRATGTGASIGAALPNAITDITGWGTEAKTKQATIDRVKQVIGKALEGGVLRKEDEIKYAKILPTISDTALVVKAKLAGLKKAIAERRTTMLDALEDAGYEVGRYRSRGGQGGSVRVKGADGKTYEFPNQEAADAFKKAGG